MITLLKIIFWFFVYIIFGGVLIELFEKHFVPEKERSKNMQDKSMLYILWPIFLPIGFFMYATPKIINKIIRIVELIVK